MRSLTQSRTAPSVEEVDLARKSSHVLARIASQEESLVLQVEDSGEQALELPPTAVSLLLEVLEAISAGKTVTVVPDETELTTVEAAHLLNVSRPFLIKLLESGEIPYRKVGTHRRVRLKDVLTFKAKDDLAREAALDELVREAQEQDMGYGQ